MAGESTERTERGATRTPDDRRVSRAPVIVVAFGLALAVGLVLIGARLAAAPAPIPDLSSPGTASAPRAVNVIMRDYLFNPTPLHLVPGEVVEFTIVNGGLVEHEFVLGDEPVQRAWAQAHLAATPPAPFATPPSARVPEGTGGLRVLLGSGHSTSVLYEVPADAGGLQLMCHLPGHVERGMVGRIELAGR
jgi:uncharacterized cupredoxin-like copper-binding protein